MAALIVLAIVLLLVLGVLGYVWSTYNSLVRTRELVKNAKGQIAVQMETRWDALTSLIEATKQYAAHESQVLTDVVAQRASVGKNSAVKDLEHDDHLFNGALGRINAVAENYPQLKAAGVYQQAMAGVTQYEENLRMSRMVFNDTATKLNRMILMFPSSLVARSFGFTEEAYFEVTAGKTAAPSWN